MSANGGRPASAASPASVSFPTCARRSAKRCCCPSLSMEKSTVSATLTAFSSALPNNTRPMATWPIRADTGKRRLSGGMIGSGVRTKNIRTLAASIRSTARWRPSNSRGDQFTDNCRISTSCEPSRQRTACAVQSPSSRPTGASICSRPALACASNAQSTRKPLSLPPSQPKPANAASSTPSTATAHRQRRGT